jgi:hypothetical protein
MTTSGRAYEYAQQAGRSRVRTEEEVAIRIYLLRYLDQGTELTKLLALEVDIIPLQSVECPLSLLIRNCLVKRMLNGFHYLLRCY